MENKGKGFQNRISESQRKNQYPLMFVSQQSSSIVVKIRCNLLLSLPVCSLPEDNGGQWSREGLHGAQGLCA